MSKRHCGEFQCWTQVWELWHAREFGYRTNYEGSTLFNEASTCEVDYFCARRHVG